MVNFCTSTAFQHGLDSSKVDAPALDLAPAFNPDSFEHATKGRWMASRVIQPTPRAGGETRVQRGYARAARWKVRPCGVVPSPQKLGLLAPLVLPLLLVAPLLSACGPIEAPPGMADLRRNPGAFQEQFDREVGVHRLVLLLSPA